jgi:hypothetical protein
MRSHQSTHPTLIDFKNLAQARQGNNFEEKLYQLVREALSRKDFKDNNLKLQVSFNQNHIDILVYLLSKTTFSFSTVKISFNRKLEIIDVIRPVETTEFTYHQLTANTHATRCPDENVRFVIATPVYDPRYANVPPAIDATYEAAIEKYGKDKVVTLLNKDANQENYQNYLSCPLDAFFSIGHSDGTQLFLFDGPSLFATFFQNTKLNLSNTAIVFNSCLAFSALPNGLCEAITKFNPIAYSSGISELLIYGSTETYACFWQKVLRSESPLTKKTLQDCALAWDPSVPESQSPVYLNIGADTYEATKISATIRTNLNNYTVNVETPHITIPFEKYEAITDIILHINQTIEMACPPNKNISFIPGLHGIEYDVYYNGVDPNQSACLIVNTLEGMTVNGSLFEDYYGIYPNDACQNAANEPPENIAPAVNYKTLQSSSASRTATSFLQTSLAYVSNLIDIVKEELKRDDLGYWTSKSMQTFFTTAALTVAAKTVPLLLKTQVETLKLGR